MKSLLCICAALAMALAPGSALAATDVTGSWTGDMKAPDGSTGFTLSFTFKQDGAKLTGTVQGPQGEAIAISDGKVDGDKISFKVSVNGMVIAHEGTIVASPDGNSAGDTIKLGSQSDQMGNAGNFTLKRVKAAATTP
jgi:hypothetical protein